MVRTLSALVGPRAVLSDLSPGVRIVVDLPNLKGLLHGEVTRAPAQDSVMWRCDGFVSPWWIPSSFFFDGRVYVEVVQASLFEAVPA